MKFKVIEENLTENRGDTTLREVLVVIAKMLRLIPENDDRTWSLHHLDGNHMSNDMQNLCIMERGRHSSYHNKIRSAKISLKTPEAYDFLVKNYRGDFIEVGKVMLEKLSAEVTADEKVAEKSISD